MKSVYFLTILYCSGTNILAPSQTILLPYYLYTYIHNCGAILYNILLNCISYHRTLLKVL